MWMTELATKTITAESRIGSHSEATPETRLAVMGTPCIFLIERVPKALSARSDCSAKRAA